MKARRMLLLAIAMMMSVHGFAEESDPAAIFEKVTAKYKSMQTYKADGTIVTDMETSGMKIKAETSFSMSLKKPNLYLITWTQKGMPMPGMSQSGAVWNAGSQPYLYMGIMNAYSKMENDEMALAGATGISGGAAFTIPSLFLSVFKDQSSCFSRLLEPKLEKIEKVEDEECYVISGSSTISKKETFWISKKDYLLIKSSRSFEPPEGGMTIPEISDEELEEAMKAMGQEVTEETKEQMKNIMEMAQDSMKTAELKGTSTELHLNITMPELGKEDFEFELPPETILKKSLLGELLGDSEVEYTTMSFDEKVLSERMQEYLSTVWSGKYEEAFKLISPICIKNLELTLRKFSEEWEILKKVERKESISVEYIFIKDDQKHAHVMVKKVSWIRYRDATSEKIEEKRETTNLVYLWVKENSAWYVDFSSTKNVY